jgi:hypothetical protein
MHVPTRRRKMSRGSRVVCAHCTVTRSAHAEPGTSARRPVSGGHAAAYPATRVLAPWHSLTVFVVAAWSLGLASCRRSVARWAGQCTSSASSGLVRREPARELTTVISRSS